MSSSTLSCLGFDILLLRKCIQHLPPLLKMAQCRAQLYAAYIYLCELMAPTILHLPAADMFSTSVRLW